MANELLVRILGDTKGLERSFARANQATATFGRNVEATGAKVDKTARSFKGLATGAAAGFAGAFVANEVLNQARVAIDVASNLQEQVSKTGVVFGQAAEEVEDWSKRTAEGIGLAQDQALAAASTFGAMFDQAGRSAADAAGLSQAVVELAADLASFNNTDVDEALTALRSGLSGEIEPLRRFQVFLTEAAVAQQAMADSGKTNVKQLTQGEKIMARWALILQQTSKQQGDFGRTSSGLANQQRILNAQTRNLQANVGQLLLPAMTAITEELVQATDTTIKLVDAMRDLAGVVIPPIKIVLDIEVPGTSLSGLDAAKFIAKRASPWSFFFNVQDLVNAFRGDANPAASARELAQAFEKDVGTFMGTLEKETTKSVQNAAKSFGEKGFKPLPENTLGEEMAKRFEDTLAALSLKFDQAAVTKGTRDDLAVLAEMKRVILARIATHGKTTDLLRLLFDVDQQRQAVIDGAASDAQAAREETQRAIEDAAQKRRELAEKARAALQASQFRALGLSESGDEIVPGFKNLATRIDAALQKVSSGEVDISSKLVDRLKLARTLIKREGGKLTEDTRRVINDLIRTVTQGGDELAKGPLTKTSSLNASKLLEGLGLGRDMEKELRARLSSFNTAGLALPGATTRPTGQFVGGGTINVQNDTTVTLDGDVVGRKVTKSQQKARRRNPRQKRGPNGGI